MGNVVIAAASTGLPPGSRLRKSGCLIGAGQAAVVVNFSCKGDDIWLVQVMPPDMEMQESVKKNEEGEEKEEEGEEWTMDKLLGFGRFHHFQLWVIQALLSALGRLQSFSVT
jgi:hypothetical protein